MGRMLAVDGRHCIRSAIGRWSIRAASFVDIFMPHMRGFESIRIFHERAPTVPLIAMSGYAFANLNSPAPDFLRMALELGASRCLRKPFTPAALQVAINQCLSEHSDAVSVRLG